MRAQPLPVFNFGFQNNGNDSVDIYIDGYIVDAPTQEFLKEYWGDTTSVSYRSIRDQVTASKPKEVNVYVNSGGGSVIDAMAAHDFFVDLQNKGVTVNRYGRGIVASAATYLVMGKGSQISKNSWFMIHNVSGLAYGDVNDIENAARMMRKFNDQVRDLYCEYTGLPKETISNWMNKETWFTGQEATDKKFVENCIGNVEFTNAIKPEQWLFSNTAVLNTYNSFVKPTSSNLPDMDMKKIGELITNAVTSAFKALNLGTDKKISDLKPEDLQNTISTAITDSLKAITDEMQTSIDTAISNAIKDKGVIANAIAQAITDAIADKGAIQTAIANAITEAIKDMPTNKAIKKLEREIGNKLSGAGSPAKKNKKEDESPYNHESIEWGQQKKTEDSEEDDDDDDDDDDK